MKKIIIINLLALFAASSAFAAATQGISFTAGNTGLSLYGAPVTATVTGGVPAAGTILIGKCSTGVGVGWNTGTGGYAINTQHMSGTRAFGTTFDSTAVYTHDEQKGVAEAVPGASDSSAFDGWQTM